MSNAAKKHFNSGNVFGKVVEYEKKTSTSGKDYLTLKVSVGGQKCGNVHAYCRIWGEEECTPFLAAHRKAPQTPVYLKGFYSQYHEEGGEWKSNFTIFQWEQRDQVDPRAVFILRGVVDFVSRTTDGGQRMLLKVIRENNPEETFELWAPGELLLDTVAKDQVIEAKGYVRQAETEDEFGGSSGPIRAYVHQLRVL